MKVARTMYNKSRFFFHNAPTVVGICIGLIAIFFSASLRFGDESISQVNVAHADTPEGTDFGCVSASCECGGECCGGGDGGGDCGGGDCGGD